MSEIFSDFRQYIKTVKQQLSLEGILKNNWHEESSNFPIEHL